MAEDREEGKRQESILAVVWPQVLQGKHEKAKWKRRQYQTSCGGVSFKCKLGLCRYQGGIQFSSVQFSHSVMSDSLQPHEPQHTRPPCPSPTPGVHPNPCPLCRWCHPIISSSVVPFSSCPQSLPASRSFQMSQLSTSGGQSTGVSALASFLPKKSQGWSLSEWTGWISLQSKGLSRVFSNTTVQKHQFLIQYSAFFIVQPSYPYMTTGKTIPLTRWTFVGKVMFLLFNMLSETLGLQGDPTSSS